MSSPPRRLVNIKQIEALRGMSYPAQEAACASARSPPLPNSPKPKSDLAAYPMLAEALQEAASPQIRNLATIGGNMCQRPRCWYFRNGMGLMAENRGRQVHGA